MLEFASLSEGICRQTIEVSHLLQSTSTVLRSPVPVHFQSQVTRLCKLIGVSFGCTRAPFTAINTYGYCYCTTSAWLSLGVAHLPCSTSHVKSHVRCSAY